MQKAAKIFRSHQEQAEADRAFYRDILPAEQLEILLEILERTHTNAPQPRFQRVYRIVPLGGR
jgi:DNA-binding GntR family transcriptional regulator